MRALAHCGRDLLYVIRSILYIDSILIPDNKNAEQFILLYNVNKSDLFDWIGIVV